MNINANISGSQHLQNRKSLKQQQNIKFTGVLQNRIIQQQINDHLRISSEVLSQSPRNIFQMLKGSLEKRVQFFDVLVEKYNGRNFYEEVKESSQHVNNIFKMVKRPNKNHFHLASKLQDSFEDLEKLMQATKGNSRRVTFAVNTLALLEKNKPGNAQLITELLTSKNSRKYVSNFEKYKSYLIINNKDKNMVKNLDSMVESGTFNPKKYDIELSSKNIFNDLTLSETNILNKRVIEKNYTEKGQEFLETLTKNYYITHGSLKAGNDVDILSMYKSTTKNNIGIRKFILENIDNNKLDNASEQGKNIELTELTKLFETIDKDKNARNFVEKAIENRLSIGTAKEFNNILANISTKKLNTFFNNAKNIVFQTRGEARIATLQKEIENPFFETSFTKLSRRESVRYGYTKKESVFSKVRKFVSNQFNVAIDRVSGGSKPVAQPSPNKIVTTPVTETIAAPAELVAKKIDTPPVQSPVRSILKRVPQKAPNAKKLVVINDVNNIIEKKLGAKMLQEQKREYAIKATKMRMNLLPEIFTSIKETRAADRAAGKMKFNSSNRDALDLYERINGKNKRLVSYMLKKRNSDGARMFEVKDIIDLLKKSEREVINAKKASPEFKSVQEKAYYKQMVDAKIQQYGKI